MEKSEGNEISISNFHRRWVILMTHAHKESMNRKLIKKAHFFLGSLVEKKPVFLKTGIFPKTASFTLVVLLMMLLCIALSAANVSLAHANEKSIPVAEKKSESEEISVSEIEKKVDELKQRIETDKLAENEQTARQFQVTLGDLQDRTAKLRAIRGTYERLLTALGKRKAMKKEEALLREKISVGQQVGIRQAPPFFSEFL
jgi:uncharacterized protein YlxW (UPF0749 family)